MVGPALARKPVPLARGGAGGRRHRPASHSPHGSTGDFARLDSSPAYLDGEMEGGLEAPLGASYGQMLGSDLPMLDAGGFYAKLGQPADRQLDETSPARHKGRQGPAPSPPPIPSSPTSDGVSAPPAPPPAPAPAEPPAPAPAEPPAPEPAPPAAPAAAAPDGKAAGKDSEDSGKKDKEAKKKDEEEKEGKEDAGGQAPAQKAATDKVVAGLGGKRGSEDKAPAQEPDEPGEAMWTPPVPLRPDTQPIFLAHQSLSLNVEQTEFDAPRRLPFAPVPADEKGKPPPAMPDYRGLYSDAAAAGISLYAQLRDGAQRLADEASGFEARLHGKHRSSLEGATSRLDRDLERARVSLAMGRDGTLRELDRRALILRRRIGGTAEAQLGKLDKRKKDYDAKRKGPRAIAKQTSADATKRAGDMAKAIEGGESKLRDLQADKKLIAVSDGSTWNPSTNEAIENCLPKVLQESFKQFGEFHKKLTPLQKLAGCLDCQFEDMFAGVDAAAERVGTAGPTAVRESRDSGINSLEKGVRQLRRGIFESAAATDDALVKQHDAVRAKLIGSAKVTMTDERDRLQATASRQVDTLTGMAKAQPAAVQAIVDRLAGARSSPEPRFASVAAQTSRQLKASLARTAARQPMAVLLAARNQHVAMEASGARFDSGLFRSDEDTERSNRELSSATLDQLAKETDKLVEGLSGIPRSLVLLCARFFEPEKPPYTDALTALADSVNRTRANTEAAFTGKPTGQEPAKETKEEKTEKKGSANCPARCTEKEPAEKKEGNGPEKTDPGTAKKDDKAKPPVKPGDGDDLSNAAGITAYATKVAGDVKEAQLVGQLHASASGNVPDRMETRNKAIHSGLGGMSADRDKVVSALHGSTAIQGNNFRSAWRGGGTLDDMIRKKFLIGWSTRGTKDADRDAALSALDGDAAAAAISELRAAFNLWDDNQKAFDAMLALSPEALANMTDAQKAELKAMAGEMEGINKEKFEALIEGNVAKYNALTMQSDIKSKRGVEGEKAWTDVGVALEGYSRGAGESALSGNSDRFGIDPTQDGPKHNEEMWKKTELEFGKVELGASATKDKDGKPLSEEKQLEAAQKALINLATADHTRKDKALHETKDPPASYTTVVTDRMDAEHKKWIERIVMDGADSNKALAARLAISDKTNDPKLAEEHLRKALHFPSADAADGGQYDKERRDKGLEKAEERRKEVLIVYGQDKEEAKTGKRPDPSTIKIDEVVAGLKSRIEVKFAKDAGASEMLIGIVEKPRGNPLATIEYGIAHEKKEVIIDQFKRMDREEVEQLIKDYASKHKGEKGLDEVLGINGHHWTWRNWNGAVFSGDEANQIEIARMGVPQNPQERGEVALRVMKQQKDQSTWLGRHLAGSEYDALEANAAALQKAMGVKDADIDSRGYIRTTDPLTGMKVHLGNFDEKGNFVPTEGAQFGAFERAVAMASVTAENYTAAVDRISDFVATALVVIAAVVTTALTGGAAASIWIPMLVTAGAGLAGMGFKVAMKGGRYGRDEMVRDLVATVVQAATAGFGAAAGTLLRGGPVALKALAGSWRMSEQMLAEVVAVAAAKKAGTAVAEIAIMRSLSLAEEVAIGAASSAFAGGAQTAFDPAVMRGDNYWSDVLHATGKGALGGGLGALGARGGSKAFEWASKRLGSPVSQKAMQAALAAGKSKPEAMLAGEQALAKHWATEVGARAFSSGTSGMVSRGGEMMYDKHVRGQDIGYGEIFHEMGAAGLQNFIQGAGEGAADRHMRSRSSSRAEEHAWVEDQHRKAEEKSRAQTQEAETAGMMAFLRASGAIRDGPDHAPTSAKTQASAAEPAAVTGARAHPETAAPAAIHAPPVEPPAVGGGRVTHEEAASPSRAGSDAQESSQTRPAHAEEEAARLARIADPDPEPAGSPGKSRPREEEPVAHSLDDGNKTVLKGANDNEGEGGDAVHAVADLSKTDMVKLGSIPEGSVFIHPDSTDNQAANDNFGRMILADPGREVSHLYNPVTGDNIVVQGGKTVVGVINAEGKLTRPGKGKMPTEWMNMLGDNGKAGHWILRSHYHPNMVAEGGFHPSLASGAGKDFSVIIREALDHGYLERSSRIYYVDKGKLQFADFTVNLAGGADKYTISIPDPATGKHVTKPFASMEAYHGFLAEQTGHSFKIPAWFREESVATAPVGPKRALESGSPTKKLSAGDLFSIHDVQLKVTAGDHQEAHAMVKRMGLVGEPDSMARLQLALNARGVPLEVRQALADTVFAATREHMIASGQLGADEKLHMFFHGAPQKRSQSMKDGGIQLGLVGSGHNDDFGQGLYLTYGKTAAGANSGLENAEIYAGRDLGKGGGGKLKAGEKPGDVFSFFVRERDMGVVVDVSKGGAHREAWEKFSMKHVGEIGEGMLIGKPPAFEQVMKREVPFGTFDASGNRGAVFDKFLQHLGETTGQPHLAHPDIVFGELGGPFTSGYGRGEQAALRVKAGELARLMNEQIGFRGPGTTEPLPARRSDEPDPSAHALTKSKKKAPAAATAPPSPAPAPAPAPAPGATTVTPALAPTPPAPARSKDPSVAQLDTMLAALASPHPDGPKALAARIKAGGPGAVEAQEKLNAMSSAPKDAPVINITQAQIEAALPPPNGQHQQVRVVIHGLEMRVYRSAPTPGEPPPVARFEATMPGHQPGRTPPVYQFGDGELRVWRSAPTAEHPIGVLTQESIVGPRRERGGDEDHIYSHGEGEYAGSALERAHLQGPGRGMESPFGIGLAPKEVNQLLQSKGIEAYISRLRDTLPPGAELLYETNVTAHWGTSRQARIGYRLDIAIEGRRVPFAEFAINIETDPPRTPRGKRKGTTGISVEPLEMRHSHESDRVNSLFGHLRESVDTPQVLLHGLPRQRPLPPEVIKVVHGSTTKELENAAKESGGRLATHRPKPKDDFSFSQWKKGLLDRLGRDDPPQYLIVDTRDLNLTAAQKKKIEALIAKLPDKDRDKIIWIK